MHKPCAWLKCAAELQNCKIILCAPEHITLDHVRVARRLILGCLTCLTCLSPRALHLRHSTRPSTTQEGACNKSSSEIHAVLSLLFSKLRQSRHAPSEESVQIVRKPTHHNSHFYRTASRYSPRSANGHLSHRWSSCPCHIIMVSGILIVSVPRSCECTHVLTGLVRSDSLAKAYSRAHYVESMYSGRCARCPNTSGGVTMLA